MRFRKIELHPKLHMLHISRQVIVRGDVVQTEETAGAPEGEREVREEVRKGQCREGGMDEAKYFERPGVADGTSRAGFWAAVGWQGEEVGY